VIGRWTVVNGILVVVILALGIQIARTWMRTLPATRIEAPGAEGDADGRRPARRTKPAQNDDASAVVAAITAKDLFDPSRSGTAAGTVADAQPATPPPPPGVIVVGVRMVGPDTEAVVEDTSANKEQRRIRAGDSIGDYTVDAIHETSVDLSTESGESVTLWLEVGAGNRPVPQKATPPRPAPAIPSPARVTPTVTPIQRAATRRAAQRAARRRARERRSRQGTADLPAGVRERLEALRRNR
jgi:hypothetical protein